MRSPASTFADPSHHERRLDLVRANPAPSAATASTTDVQGELPVVGSRVVGSVVGGTTCGGFVVDGVVGGKALSSEVVVGDSGGCVVAVVVDDTGGCVVAVVVDDSGGCVVAVVVDDSGGSVVVVGYSVVVVGYSVVVVGCSVVVVGCSVVVVGGGSLHFITQECGASYGLPLDGLIEPVAVKAPVDCRFEYTVTTDAPSLMIAASYSAGMYPLSFSYFVQSMPRKFSQYDSWFIDADHGTTVGAAREAPLNMAVLPKKLNELSTGSKAAMLNPAAVGHQLLHSDARR
jgi:hypothetical protein